MPTWQLRRADCFLPRLAAIFICSYRCISHAISSSAPESQSRGDEAMPGAEDSRIFRSEYPNVRVHLSVSGDFSSRTRLRHEMKLLACCPHRKDGALRTTDYLIRVEE